MIKAKIIIVLGFALAFGAGVVTGMLLRQKAVEARAADPLKVVEPPKTRPSLSTDLDLKPEQEEQMHKIWSSVRQQMDDRRRVLRKERDEAIDRLLTAEQKPLYEKVRADYEAKMSPSDLEGRRIFDEAVKQTKAILNDKQRVRYEEILKKRESGWHGRGPGRRPDEKATSRPASE